MRAGRHPKRCLPRVSPGDRIASAAPRRQRRRPATLDQAYAHWFAGDYELTLGACDAAAGSDPRARTECSLLRARALLRLGRPGDALAVLDAVRRPATGDETTTATMLRGAAHIRADDVERGLALLDALQSEATGAHPTIRSEIALNRSLGYFCRRDVDAADRALDLVDPTADIVFARALEYRGWIACARTRYGLAAHYFRAALDFLDTCRHHDRYLEANCTQVLATLAIERLDLPLWQIVSERRAKIDWSSPDLQRHRFWIGLCAATYAYEIDGADLAALAEARFAETIAPTPAARVEALCRRAATVGRARERLAHDDHTAAAYDLFVTLDPAQFDGYDQFVPLILAKELALAGRVDDARRVFAIYKDNPQSSPLLAVTGDPTRFGFEKLIEGFVAEAADERTNAHHAYLEAFVTFRKIEYARRAVHAALRLGRLLNEPELFAYAREATRHLPQHAWLRRQVDSAPTDVVMRALKPAQIDVLRLLCTGKTAEEIAAIRGRTIGTTKNATSEIYRAFGVRNRTELVNELLRRGILTPT